MAESMSSVPGVLTFTLGAANVATQVNFPNNARRVRIFFVTDAGKVAVTGTDGGAIVANFYPVTADADWALVVDQDQAGGKGPAPVFLATATGSTVVRLVCES